MSILSLHRFLVHSDVRPAPGGTVHLCDTTNSWMIFIEITSRTGQIFQMDIATGLETRMLRPSGTVQMSPALSPGRFARYDLTVRETHWCFHPNAVTNHQEGVSVCAAPGAQFG